MLYTGGGGRGEEGVVTELNRTEKTEKNEGAKVEKRYRRTNTITFFSCRWICVTRPPQKCIDGRTICNLVAILKVVRHFVILYIKIH
jgi:hypothetical protein